MEEKRKKGTFSSPLALVLHDEKKFAADRKPAPVYVKTQLFPSWGHHLICVNQ